MINKITMNSISSSYNCLNNSNNDVKDTSFKRHHHGSENNLTKKQKAVILASSAAGMTPVLAFLAHRRGFSLNPVKIFKTPVKDWAIFKYSPKNKSIEFEAPQILAVASGSVAGGFIGGAMVDDKSNMRAKKREVLSQLLGNVSVPVACVWSGSKIYNKFADKIEGAMPQFKGDKKSIKVINKILTKLPNAATTVGLLGVGIYLGNMVSNFINEKLYHQKVERDIKASDFAPHVDDLCMAASMMNKESEFGSKLGRVIPVALLVPGYQTGCAQEKK